MTIIENYLERKEKKEQIVELMENGNWTAVLEHFQGEDKYHEPLLVWMRPTKECLDFIRVELNKLRIDTISSVGCGCGFLEWLLIKATGLKICGFEVNRGWWESPHATPHYIQLEYLDPDSSSGGSCIIPPSSAIMFNYFNHIQYFNEYLNKYSGKCVILIGPIDGNRHCDPEPRFLEGHPDWRLQASYNLHGEDEIAIYARRRPWALVAE